MFCKGKGDSALSAYELLYVLRADVSAPAAFVIATAAAFGFLSQGTAPFSASFCLTGTEVQMPRILFRLAQTDVDGADIA